MAMRRKIRLQCRFVVFANLVENKDFLVSARFHNFHIVKEALNNFLYYRQSEIVHSLLAGSGDLIRLYSMMTTWMKQIDHMVILTSIVSVVLLNKLMLTCQEGSTHMYARVAVQPPHTSYYMQIHVISSRLQQESQSNSTLPLPKRSSA